MSLADEYRRQHGWRDWPTILDAPTPSSARRRKLQAERERALREEMAAEVAGRVAEVLDQVMTRFESLEERLEFSEQLMLERPPEKDRDA